MFQGSWLRACASLVLGVLVCACGGATFQNDVYDDGVVRYRVGKRAPGFSRIEVDDNDLAFHDPALGTISINSTCSEYEDVPEEALVNHLLFGTRERRFRLEETVTLDGRGARHVIVDVELDGVPMTLELYVLKKDGCVYDLSRIAPAADHDAGAEAFRQLVAGFHVLSTRHAD